MQLAVLDLYVKDTLCFAFHIDLECQSAGNGRNICLAELFAHSRNNRLVCHSSH